MAGGRQHIHTVLSALHIRTACNGTSVKFKYLLHDIIRIIIVIPVLWRLIMYHTVNPVISFIIMFHGLDQFFHGKILLIKHVVFYSRKAVGHCADTHALDIVRVVSGSARIVILCIGDTVVRYNRKTRRRHLLCIKLLDHIVAADLDIYNIGKLLLKCLPQILIGLEILRIPQFQPDLFPGILVEPIEQSQLKHLRNIQISGKNISLAAPCARLHASGRAAPPCIFKVLSCIDQFHNLCLRIIKRRLPPSFSGNLAGSLKEFRRSLFTDRHIRVWLYQFHLVHTVQNQITDIVHTVSTVRRHTACIDIRKIRISRTLL